MRNDLTDITVLLDRSGSMASCKTDAEGGLNTLIQEQAKLPGDVLFTLCQFDTEYEFVHKGVNLKNVIPVCSLVPRGSTALLDATGRAIIETGERLKKIDEKDRPGLVVFVTITDGLENSSHEFTKAKIKEMVEHQQSQYKWKFIYLGANQDAFAEAGAMGYLRTATANYDAEQKTAGGFKAASAHVGRLRTQALHGQEVVSAFTDEERNEMV